MSSNFSRIALLILLLVIILFVPVKARADKGEYVVLLHGIARSSNHMQGLADYLSVNGYEVINLDYPSTSFNLEELSAIINDEILQEIDQDRQVNFVGYSMGGLLVRIILNKYHYNNLGRVVQLAAPNQGSEVANFLQGSWLYRKIFGKAGQQLITNQDKISNLLKGNINYELGIIPKFIYNATFNLPIFGLKFK